VISQVGFVGDIYLLLSVDDTVNERIRVGDTIPSEEQVQMNVMMAKLKVLSQSVDILIKDIDKLFSEKNIQGIENLIGSTNRAILSGSSNLNEVSTSMKATADKLGMVLSEVEDLFRNNKGDVTQLIKQAKKDLEQAGEMIKSMESTARAVEKTSKSADRAITLQSRNIENLIETMAKTTEDLQELLQEMKQKPWSLIYRERGK
jgi:phospholipid/cholesterol/gamma-HCH transport system substrate-binding protein